MEPTTALIPLTVTPGELLDSVDLGSADVRWRGYKVQKIRAVVSYEVVVEGKPIFLTDKDRLDVLSTGDDVQPVTPIVAVGQHVLAEIDGKGEGKPIGCYGRVEAVRATWLRGQLRQCAYIVDAQDHRFAAWVEREDIRDTWK